MSLATVKDFPALAHIPSYMIPWAKNFRTFNDALYEAADRIGGARKFHKEFTVQDILTEDEAALETPETLAKNIQPWDFALALVYAQAQ